LAAAAGAGLLLIPGTGSTGHLRENLVAEHVALDDQALRELAGVSMWPS
jgi:aryl-alcohol dehydrogenase-like predicted oxidoreductase